MSKGWSQGAGGRHCPALSPRFRARDSYPAEPHPHTPSPTRPAGASPEVAPARACRCFPSLIQRMKSRLAHRAATEPVAFLAHMNERRVGIAEDPDDGRAGAKLGKAIRIPQPARSSWRWHASIMPDSCVAAPVFPPAATAGLRTLSPLFSPTHFHEDLKKKARSFCAGLLCYPVCRFC